MAAGSLVLAACGGGSSEDTSVRTKNAALDTTIACTLGGSGPTGGIVLSLAADPAGDSIEGARVPRQPNEGSVAAARAAALKYAADMNVGGVNGWAIPTIETLMSVKGRMFESYGVNNYWSSSEMSGYPLGLYYNGNQNLVQSFNYALYLAVPMRTFKASTSPCISPPTTTVPPTTTTIPPTCANGGLCGVGDTGPGGGQVVSMNRGADGVSNVVEIAPVNWSGDVYTSGDASTAKASSYTGGGKKDWGLPSRETMISICRTPNSGFVAGRAYWAIGGERTGKSLVSSYDCSARAAGGSTEFGDVRPVRIFNVGAAVFEAAVGYFNANPTTTTSTTTTTTTTTTLPPTTTSSSTTTTTTTTSTSSTTSVRPTTTTVRPTTTTTTLVPCTNLAVCAVGQRGPGGGRILKRYEGEVQPSYLEIAPDGWFGSGRDPLVSLAEAQRIVQAYRGGGQSDWKLPDTTTIEILCKFALGRDINVSGVCNDDTTPVTVAGGFGDGTSNRFGSFYWFGTSRDQLDFASGRYQRDYRPTAHVRPVRMWSYIPPTTTTTIAKSCAQGGRCAIGDISPNGGLIIDISSSDYTEIAPKTWSPENSTSDPAIIKEGAVIAAAKYRSANGASDWRLPTDREMRAAFLYFMLPTFNSDCSAARGGAARTVTLQMNPYTFGGLSYWINEPNRPTKLDNFNYASGAAYYDVTNLRYSVRPFRTTPYQGGAPAVGAEWNPSKCRTAVIPTTTTTTHLVGCSGRGRCRIGDVGPNGGIIIFISGASSTGDVTYTEMKAQASRRDCFGSTFGNSCTKGDYDEFQSTFGLNGVFDFYPTAQELNAVARNRSLKTKLDLRNDVYWTNYYRIGTRLSADVNGSLNDLGRSLELNKVKEGQVVNIATGSPGFADFAYFRGVNRWKCQYSCR